MKKREEENAIKETPQSPKEKKTEYIEFRIPRINFKNPSMNGFLIMLLVIFAFLLGMLTNKVLYLEKAASQQAAEPTTNPEQAGEIAVSPPPQVVDVEQGNLPLLGDADAPVTIVEFSDFQCPFCKSYIDGAHSQLIQEYIDTGKVKLAFRHFPLSSIHPNAQKAGEASECANDQGNFWGYHDVLFEKQDAWSALSADAIIDEFSTYAGELGLDQNAFRSCLENDTHAQKVLDDVTAGSAVQVDGTPTFFINGYRVVGAVPYEELKLQIEEALSK